MLRYIVKRVLIMAALFAVISVLVFSLIQMPPGDFLTMQIAHMEAEGSPMQQGQIDSLTKRYNLDQPMAVRYFGWRVCVGPSARANAACSSSTSRCSSPL